MKNRFPLLVILGCLALLAFGLVQLFELRFETGDVYAPYSSLRADPLGTMAVYESLGKLPGISVHRDFSTSNRLPDEPGTVYLHLAAGSFEWEWMPEDLYQEITKFVGGGGRLVIAFFPQPQAPYRYFDDENETNSFPPAKTKSGKEKNLPAKPARKKRPFREERSFVNVEEEWGIHKDFEEMPQAGGTYQPVTVLNQGYEGLPHSLEWHSAMVFTNCDRAWTPRYTRGTNPVVLERRFGKGSVVLASDSYLFSNEAMTKNRQPAYLAWIIGSNHRVVFDEAHLGIVDTSGVATLMRQYRLHGLMAGLLLLAGLFIWKNATGLVPPQAAGKQDDVVAGKDSASGFVNLLRRNISTRDILVVCFAEWNKTAASAGKLSAARRQQAADVFEAEKSKPARERNPVAAYRKISEILGNRIQKL